MEELRSKRARLLLRSEPRTHQGAPKSEAPLAFHIAALNQEISKLRESLPAPLQVLEDADDSNDVLSQIQSELHQEARDRGFVELHCFWEPNAGFDRSPLELKMGDVLSFSVDDANDRIGIYVATDGDGSSVGMLINLMDVQGEYYEFADALTDFLGKSRFSGELLSIADEREENSRIYFTVKATPYATSTFIP